MSRNLPDGIPSDLVAQSRDNPCGELAWQYPAILVVVDTLAALQYAILGGDVMFANERGILDYYQGDMYCGNWGLDWTLKEPWSEYVAASVATSKRYIEAYVQRNGDTYWYAPSFTDEIGYSTLPQH